MQKKVMTTKPELFELYENTFDKIINVVCQVTGVEKKEILGERGKVKVYEARHLFVYLVKLHSRATHTMIAYYLKRHNPTSASNSYYSFTDMIQTNTESQLQFEKAHDLIISKVLPIMHVGYSKEQRMQQRRENKREYLKEYHRKNPDRKKLIQKAL